VCGKGKGSGVFHLAEPHNLDRTPAPQAVLHLILEKCLACARISESDDPRKVHALETFSAAAKCILAKNLEGWEVMTVFAGEVGQSDRFFMVGGAPSCHNAVGLTSDRS
jgi:hypothetical protein